MSSYMEVRSTDLEHVILSYISSWKTVVVAGLAFQNKKLWYPGAFFAWTDPASSGRRAECQVIGHPNLPRYVRLIKEWCYPPRSLYILTEIIKGSTVEFNKTPVTFANFRFNRSAFLSSAGFDHLYCQEIQPFTAGKPKFFVEGALDNDVEWERLYKQADMELASTKYLYHTLHDATGSLIGIKTGTSINRSLLQFVLAIPIKMRATSDSRRMKYVVSIDPDIRISHTEIRYTGQTGGSERELRVKLPQAKVTEGSLRFAGSLTIPSDTVATSLSLLLDGMRVEAIPIERSADTRTSQESESMERAKDSMMPAIGGISMLFGMRMGKQNISRICDTLGYDPSKIAGTNKSERISSILRTTYVENKPAFETFIMALLVNHEISKTEMIQLNAYLKELGYKMSSGTLIAISGARDTEHLIEFAFPGLSQEAKTMAESYAILYTLENALREFVRDTLAKKFGANWWQKSIPKKVKLSASNTRLREMNSPWHDVKSARDLWYTTFEDLQGIIVANWDTFKGVFHSQTGAVGRLTELEIPRNTIAHNRALEASEVERLRLFARDIMKCIATSKSSTP